MTRGARVSAVIDILDSYLSGEPEHKLLSNWFRMNRYAGSKDRLAIRELFFQCLRHQLSCYWPFKEAGISINGRSIVLGMLKISNQCFDQIFDDKQYSPVKLSNLEKKVLQNFKDSLSIAPNFVKLNFPQFLEGPLKDAFDDMFEENIAALNSQADLFVRVNRIKSNVEDVKRSLEEEGIEVNYISYFQNILKVTENKRKFSKSKAFLSGDVEIQDISSQSVVDFINPKKNSKILDFCAGAGGKTLAMASLTLGMSKYFVHDINPSKLINLQKRCKRAGFKVQIFNPKQINKEYNKFDFVVADVPCSGTGVWKRHPGNKWAITKDKLNSLLIVQKEILVKAGNCVQKDGTLAYITCSVLKSENQQQIAWFLSQSSSFSFVADKVLWPIEGGDGFYVAVLIKDH